VAIELLAIDGEEMDAEEVVFPTENLDHLDLDAEPGDEVTFEAPGWVMEEKELI
jgi:hypothetical protein